MELKLFGKSIFEFGRSKGEMLAVPAFNHIKDSKFLPDFYKDHEGGIEFAYTQLVELSTNTKDTLTVPKDPEKPKAEKKKLTPKEVYNLRTLNDKDFKLATDDVYVDAQIAQFKDKLGLIQSEEYDMRRGTEQIASILVRLENRKKYKAHKDFFEQFPYTTTSKIEALVKEESHLKVGQIAQFIADMPAEATKAMKDYNTEVGKLCDKQAVFYIIADKKDFQRTDSRRDPILLAQSPFGHVWQILGAWDKEMLFLEEL